MIFWRFDILTTCFRDIAIFNDLPCLTHLHSYCLLFSSTVGLPSLAVFTFVTPFAFKAYLVSYIYLFTYNKQLAWHWWWCKHLLSSIADRNGNEGREVGQPHCKGISGILHLQKLNSCQSFTNNKLIAIMAGWSSVSRLLWTHD